MSAWTPLHLQLMLHYYSCAESFGRDHAPAVIDYTRDLVAKGMLMPADGDPLSYRAQYQTTPKGKALIEALCSTPEPEPRWVIPATTERVIG